MLPKKVRHAEVGLTFRLTLWEVKKTNYLERNYLTVKKRPTFYKLGVYIEGAGRY